MREQKEWVIVAVYVNKRTGQKHSVTTKVQGTIAEAKHKAKTAFKSTKTARVASIKVISNE